MVVVVGSNSYRHRPQRYSGHFGDVSGFVDENVTYHSRNRILEHNIVRKAAVSQAMWAGC